MDPSKHKTHDQAPTGSTQTTTTILGSFLRRLLSNVLPEISFSFLANLTTLFLFSIPQTDRHSSMSL